MQLKNSEIIETFLSFGCWINLLCFAWNVHGMHLGWWCLHPTFCFLYACLLVHNLGEISPKLPFLPLPAFLDISLIMPFTCCLGPHWLFSSFCKSSSLDLEAELQRCLIHISYIPGTYNAFLDTLQLSCSCSRYEYSLSRAWQVVKAATKILTRPLSGWFSLRLA